MQTAPSSQQAAAIVQGSAAQAQILPANAAQATALPVMQGGQQSGWNPQPVSAVHVPQVAQPTHLQANLATAPPVQQFPSSAGAFVGADMSSQSGQQGMLNIGTSSEPSH